MVKKVKPSVIRKIKTGKTLLTEDHAEIGHVAYFLNINKGNVKAAAKQASMNFKVFSRIVEKHGLLKN